MSKTLTLTLTLRAGEVKKSWNFSRDRKSNESKNEQKKARTVWNNAKDGLTDIKTEGLKLRVQGLICSKLMEQGGTGSRSWINETGLFQSKRRMAKRSSQPHKHKCLHYRNFNWQKRNRK
jgi:hypothetical protein